MSRRLRGFANASDRLAMLRFAPTPEQAEIAQHAAASARRPTTTHPAFFHFHLS
jgi:hypothetical protein